MVSDPFMQHGEYYNPAINDRILKIETAVEEWKDVKITLQNIVFWWRGNGVPGARERIEKFVTEERMEEIVKMTVKATMEEEMKKKEDSAEKSQSRRFRRGDLMIGGGLLVIGVLQTVELFIK